jgi:hypothetical protein
MKLPKEKETNLSTPTKTSFKKRFWWKSKKPERDHFL